MNTIDNKSNISFGLALKIYTNKNGTRTGDLLDASQELALYKNLTKKLKTDKFIRTELGIKSGDAVICKDDYSAKKVIRYKDSENEYFFDSSILSKNSGVKKAFGKFRAVFENIIKNN